MAPLPDITRTATEAQMMQGSANVKIDSKLNDVEHALRNIGTYMLGIAKDVYPETDVDEMAMFVGGADGRAINQLQAGDEAQAALEGGRPDEAKAIADTASLYGEAVITPTDEIFVGVYEVMVEHSTTDAVNPRVKADKYRNVMQLLAEMQPLLQQSGINVDMGRMTRLWLESENVPGVDAILGGAQPAAPPLDAAGAAGPPAGGGQPDLQALLGGLAGGGGQPPAGPPLDAISPDNS
ncbi:unnamed protein product, partial [marine sediment metagenome]